MLLAISLSAGAGGFSLQQIVINSTFQIVSTQKINDKISADTSTMYTECNADDSM